MTISAVNALVSTSAGVIGRCHYQMFFTNALAVTEKKSPGVYPIFPQLTVHSSAEIFFLPQQNMSFDGRKEERSQF